MLTKYQTLGSPLTQNEMKEIKGGVALAGRTKYNCYIPAVPPGWWVLCANVDPSTNGCADQCIVIGVCPAGPNECV